jgi:hypothetical protein
MHTTEVYIDIPCDDHLDHTSKIGSMKFMTTRTLSDLPVKITCTAVGTDNLTTARNTIVYEMEGITVKKRWPLPNGSFEFCARWSSNFERMNIQVTHCVRVEIDVHLMLVPRRPSFGNCLATTIVNRRRVCQKLATDS